MTEEIEKAYRQEFKKDVRKLCRRFAHEHDFVLLKKTTMVRNTNNILDMIWFEWPSFGIRGQMGIKPLYYPTEFVGYTCGQSFQRNIDNSDIVISPYGNKRAYDWGDNPERKEEDINDINEYLLNTVLPIFEESSSPEKFITSLLSQNSSIPGAAYYKYLYVAFSWALIGEYEKADECLNISEVEAGRTYLISDNLYHLRELIKNKEYDLIQNELQQNIINSKAAIGIE
jgi:hypothetical protein